MRILYGTSTASSKKRKELEKKYNMKSGHAVQKYHNLLINGLVKNGAEVRCISGLPINCAVTSRKLIREKDEQEGNAYFHYITTINLPVLRQLMIFFGTFFSVLKAKKDKDTYAICDCLNIANAYGMMLVCRMRKMPVVSIVTDLPDIQHSGRLLKMINNYLFYKADAFIILTEQMNERVNHNGKPYIVLEGHVDSEAPVPENQIPYEVESGKKIVMYAGSLKRIYGIKNLVEGFIRASITSSELRVYGDGDFREELESLSEKYPNVRYMGIKSNQEIVAEEQKASLLVNPRPIAPEYTKYSFPSKNMEYMVSGTPMLTTKLPGMPTEYYPYVYLIKDESPDGIAEVLDRIFAEPFEKRQAKAKEARAFVLVNKSNVVQAEKIIKFLETEL